jgi:hypothetical protein
MTLDCQLIFDKNKSLEIEYLQTIKNPFRGYGMGDLDA